jgi:non-ribosomal peptide synthetase component F
LSKITGHTDIIIGTDVVGRNHASLGGVVGNFINLLPLRTTIEPHITYAALLRTVKETVVEALDNQDIQINEIIASLRNRGNSVDKLFDVHFAYVNYIDEAQASDDFMIRPVQRSFKETTQYEFKLEATRSDSGYSISFIYSKDLYSAATIDLFIQYYENILQAITDQPDIEIGNIDMDVAGIGMVGAL